MLSIKSIFSNSLHSLLKKCRQLRSQAISHCNNFSAIWSEWVFRAGDVLKVLWWQLKEVFHGAAAPIVLVRAGFAGYGRSVGYVTRIQSQHFTVLSLCPTVLIFIYIFLYSNSAKARWIAPSDLVTTTFAYWQTATSIDKFFVPWGPPEPVYAEKQGIFMHQIVW